MNLLSNLDRRLFDEETDETQPGGGGEDETTAGGWPEDWRQQIAGDDEKALNQLGRYATPADVWKKAKSLEVQLSSGELRRVSPFPAEGSDEEKAAWRESNGIPESPDKYELTRELDDDEKPVIEGFLGYAHQNNMPPDLVNATVDYFYQRAEEQAEQAEKRDAEDAEKAQDELRAKWGEEYRAHTNRVAGALDLMSEEVKEVFLDARLPDGTKLKNSPEVQSFLLQASLALNPASKVIPDVGNDIGSIEDQLNEIREVMRTDRGKYNRDEKMQERFRALLAAQRKLKGEAA